MYISVNFDGYERKFPEEIGTDLLGRGEDGKISRWTFSGINGIIQSKIFREGMLS